MITPTDREGTVEVLAARALLKGNLAAAGHPRGLVLFAHAGAGVNGRLGTRERTVAAGLRREGLSTLQLDLLTPEEEERDMTTAELRFDIELLARRLVGAIDWLAAEPREPHLPLGLYGAGTGAAAALKAAAMRPKDVRAVVCRGGRADMAGSALEAVRSPVLLVVGGGDEPVIALNEAARLRLRAPNQLRLVPGTTHLFEEPGALDRLTDLAREWFEQHLRAA